MHELKSLQNLFRIAVLSPTTRPIQGRVADHLLLDVNKSNRDLRHVEAAARDHRAVRLPEPSELFTRQPSFLAKSRQMRCDLVKVLRDLRLELWHARAAHSEDLLG